jgi:hypothetical protein
VQLQAVQDLSLTIVVAAYSLECKAIVPSITLLRTMK